jgi:hypothetical protein
VKVKGEAVNAVEDTAAKFPICFKKIITMTAKFLTLINWPLFEENSV